MPFLAEVSTLSEALEDFAFHAHIERSMPPRHSGNTIWHYTSAEGVVGILREKAFWASSVEMLNDADELKYGVARIEKAWRDRVEAGNELQAITEWLTHARAKFDAFERSDSFVLSASKDGKSHNQFLTYGGYAIGLFPDMRLTKQAAPTVPPGSYQATGAFDTGWRPVLYEEEAQRAHIESLFDILSELAEVQGGSTHIPDVYGAAVECILRAAVYMKHPNFASEQEVRLYGRSLSTNADIDLHIGRFGVVPHLLIRANEYSDENRAPLPIHRIHLGPGLLQPQSAKRGLEVALRAFGHAQVAVVDVSGSRR